MIKLFSPHFTAGQNLTATNAAASANIAAVDEDVRIVNKNTTTGFYVRTYPSSMTVSATAADLYIAPSDVCQIRKDETHDRLSYYAPDGDCDFNLITGLGL